MRYRINRTTPDPPWHCTPTPVTQCLIALGSQELQTARKGPDVKVGEGAWEAGQRLPLSGTSTARQPHSDTAAWTPPSKVTET